MARTHPLAVLVVVFGSITALDLATRPTSQALTGLDTMAYALLLPYALFRWASGRDIVVGTATLTVAAAVGISARWTGVSDAIAAAAIVLASVALGATVRSWTGQRARELEGIELIEREHLARGMAPRPSRSSPSV